MAVEMCEWWEQLHPNFWYEAAPALCNDSVMSQQVNDGSYSIPDGTFDKVKTKGRTVNFSGYDIGLVGREESLMIELDLEELEEIGDLDEESMESVIAQAVDENVDVETEDIYMGTVPVTMKARLSIFGAFFNISIKEGPISPALKLRNIAVSKEEILHGDFSRICSALANAVRTVLLLAG